MTKWIHWQNSCYPWLLNPLAATYNSKGNVHIFETLCDETFSKTGMAENKL
jgi:hypothetical protein